MKTNYLGLSETVEEFISHLFQALFPAYFGEYEENFDAGKKTERETALAHAALKKAVSYVFINTSDGSYENADKFVSQFIENIPAVRAFVETDMVAAYEGDPAAKSIDEVILSYPAFRAITIYRFAHELYLMNVPLVPRLMTEYAHSVTGIDIHPGATIGSHFFIDHGTGVVIGETTTIGMHVKLYQQVTLGAKSFRLAPDGTPVKGIKRHPDIGDYSVIYAGATILGGDTKIGHHSVIGGNVWLTHSVAPYSVVSVSIEEKNTADR
ncbi:MAG: hypothetical protein J6Z08_03670 [Elusimicrobiales bacterium]|nr:hypothetical protein [Elusimicrobiales bacterium]